MRFPAEPFRIKVVEKIRRTTRDERVELLERAGLNVFLIPADAIYVDLLTDSGTGAMSDQQWAGLMIGDESYAGSKSYFKFEAAVRDITGFPFITPTHQGRVAENLLFSTICTEGKTVISNTHFDTTRANVEMNGAEALDLPVKEALDPQLGKLWKGNMNVALLEENLKNNRDNIPLVVMTVTNNSAGGQPVSMENILATSRICKQYGVPFFIDCARFAENCWFIHEYEPGYKGKTIIEIAREMFSHADGCWMSAKKDALVNIGGFIAMNDVELARKLQQMLILIEGFPTYGGLAGRDLEAVAVGLYEGMELDYLQYRTAQVRYLGDMLLDAGISIVRPVGGHAVFIDAKAFCDHIPPEKFPGVALTTALYREAGIRGVEIGSLMFGHIDSKTGKHVGPPLELVRLAIPRRVYTTAHMTYVAESIVELFKSRHSIKGMRLTYEAPVLRHFTARLEEVDE
ncbi:MAG: tryptophanase [Calditrichaeota bacterium]|nr:tryptophanase [Calditrichota bacterium]MCB9368732.1 tryptophanase [Calditrichota bacterium]